MKNYIKVKYHNSRAPGITLQKVFPIQNGDMDSAIRQAKDFAEKTRIESNKNYEIQYPNGVVISGLEVLPDVIFDEFD